MDKDCKWETVCKLLSLYGAEIFSLEFLLEIGASSEELEEIEEELRGEKVVPKWWNEFADSLWE